MVDINDISKQVSESTKVDIELVKKICRFPFLFTVDVMKDAQDYHNILFNQLFKFKLKKRFELDKTKNYSPKK